MLIVDIIRKKRDKIELSGDEIDLFIKSLIRGEATDAQAGAFLMASYINGFSDEETYFLTKSMSLYGDKLTIDKKGKPFIDKHSTGGVGDKVSLILLPIAACLGIGVPMISGRGLGHTGGTLDKLESIKGFNINLSDEEQIEAMDKFGGFFIGQSSSIAPADRILYKIRDVTATVASSGLITASILCKKIAENLDGLVLDMKAGRGAFMKTLEEARALGVLMQNTAENLGLKMKIVITNMNEPLGYAIGNYNEVLEVIECLNGNFPSDLKEITYRLTAEMLIIGGKCSTIADAENMIDNVINSKEALKRFYDIMKFQGGDFSYQYNTDDYYIISLRSNKEGYIHSIDSLELGNIGIEIRAGRKKENDTIDHFAGINLLAKRGDYLKKDQVIASVIVNKEIRINNIQERLLNCFEFSKYLPQAEELVLEVF